MRTFKHWFWTRYGRSVTEARKSGMWSINELQAAYEAGREAQAHSADEEPTASSLSYREVDAALQATDGR